MKLEDAIARIGKVDLRRESAVLMGRVIRIPAQIQAGATCPAPSWAA
jgi:hypothetical protein